MSLGLYPERGGRILLDRPWFDPKTGELLFDDYVTDLPSFRKVVADEIVTEVEVDEQEQRVVELFRRLERKLAPEVRDIATEALCELAVLLELHVRLATRAPSGETV